MTTKEITNNTVKKHSVILHNIFQNIRDQRKLIIIIAFLHLISVPVLLITMAYNVTSGINNAPDEGYALLTVGLTAGAGLLGIAAAMSSFRYLYKKSEVDMALSLPISRKNKFLSDFVSGLSVYIIPFIAVQVISVILMLIFHLTIDGRTYAISRYGLEVSYKCTLFGDIVKPYFELLFGGILIMVMLYALTVFIMTCCGSLFESILYTVLVNGMIPALIFSFSYSLIDNLYGVMAMYKVKNFLYFTSPAGALIGLIENISSGIDGIRNTPIIFLLLGMLVFTALVTSASYFIYMKRRAEYVGRPFVFKILYYFTISSIIISVALPAENFLKNNNEAAFFPVLILTAIVYLALEMAANRGLKGIWKGALRYVLTIGLAFGFSFLFTKTEGFGTVRNIPSANSIRKVSLSLSDEQPYTMPVQMKSLFFKLDYLDEAGFMVFEDRESIQIITDIHEGYMSVYKQIVREHGDVIENYDPSYEYHYYPITIAYYYKNGGTAVRRYSVISIEGIQTLLKLFDTESYKKNLTDYYVNTTKKEYLNAVDLNKTNGDYNPKLQIWNHGFFNSIISPVYTDNIISEYNILDYPLSLYEELSAAYAGDLAEKGSGIYDEGLDYNFKIFYLLGINYIFDDSYHRTVGVMDKYGLLDGIEFDKEIVFDEKNMKKQLALSNVSILSYDDFVNITNQNKVSDFSSHMLHSEQTNKNSSEKLKYLYENSEDLLTLLEVSRTQYITDDKCYTIIVNGIVAVIPAEYNSIAQRVYNSAREYDSTEYEKGLADGLFDTNEENYIQ